MEYSALIPFVVLFICFVGFKAPLTYSSFVALLSSTVITQTLFQATQEVWTVALTRTAEISVEIGLILMGAFFFLEVARATQTIASLANLIREVSANRVVQAILVIFPLELMIEGSSGFGTPFLIAAPILVALDFELTLCALLPFVCDVVAIPFGALGTPVRLGFPAGSEVSHPIFLMMSLLTIVAPLLAVFFISKKFILKEVLWVLLLSTTYLSSAFFITRSGPEFAALAPAFLTFVVGMISARFWFRDANPKPIQDKRGIVTYALLLLAMWIGKQFFMDRLIPGTHIRIFNPGFVFIIFGFLMMWIDRSQELISVLHSTGMRAKRTMIVFFCMTFVVQQLRECGALTKLNHALPNFLLSAGTPILGFLGSMLVGTSTVTNLLLSKVVDPVHFAALGAGSAIGVLLAFQSLVAMRSVLHDRLTEKEIFLKVAPVSLTFILITTVIYASLMRS